jgi:hypothetical protein
LGGKRLGRDGKDEKEWLEKERKGKICKKGRGRD